MHLGITQMMELARSVTYPVRLVAGLEEISARPALPIGGWQRENAGLSALRTFSLGKIVADAVTITAKTVMEQGLSSVRLAHPTFR